jgi:hypothetical protein
MKDKRCKVISIHPRTICNMEPRCSFCYKSCSDKKDEKPDKFWYDLIPYIAKLTGQVACGGGEPFMDVEFIKQMAKRCKKQGLLFNVTSNGRLLMLMADGELKEVLKDVTMISLSYDNFKIKTKQDQDNYINLVKRIHSITGCQVGANLLINQKMFEKGGRGLVETVDLLFRQGIDRVFCLGLKNMPLPDILRFKHLYMLLTYKFKHFYSDDMQKMVLEEGSYDNWKHSCHYGKDLISIDETGRAYGCSFCPQNEALLKIEKPSDLMKITKVKICERFSCPYLIKPK